MKQLGNLAIVCAKRRDLVFLMMHGEAHIEVRRGKRPYETIIVAWDDDEAIERVIFELNHGKYTQGAV